MRRLATVLICLELLAACGGLPSMPAPAPPVTRRLRAEPTRVWQAAREVLLEHGHEIRREDRSAGVLETEWFAINPDYAASILVTGQQDRYSECAKPGLGVAFRGKEVRLRLQVSPSVSREETALTLQATFRTKQYLGLPMAAGEPRALIFCRSTGWLEDELAIRIQLRTAGEQLDRLRRGGSR
jgi:hypothetical protein